MKEQWKYEYLVNEWRGARGKAHELAIIGAFFNDERLTDLRPVTQKCVFTGDGNRRLIDLYYPQIKFGIEINEGYHNSLPQQERDRIRADEIFRVEECSIKVISVANRNDVPQQIERRIQQVAHARDQKIENGQFESWEKPRDLDFHQLRSERSQTIFVKIRPKKMLSIGDVDNFEMRKRAAWVCATAKARNARFIIVVSAGTQRVIDVLEIPPESAHKEHGKWHFFDARSIEDPIIGDFVNWKANQCTRQYSMDLY